MGCPSSSLSLGVLNASTSLTERTVLVLVAQNPSASGTCCPLFQPDSQPVQSHWSVPVELPEGDGPRAVRRTQCERLCVCDCYQGYTYTIIRIVASGSVRQSQVIQVKS